MFLLGSELCADLVVAETRRALLRYIKLLLLFLQCDAKFGNLLLQALLTRQELNLK